MPDNTLPKWLHTAYLVKCLWLGLSAGVVVSFKLLNLLLDGFHPIQERRPLSMVSFHMLSRLPQCLTADVAWHYHSSQVAGEWDFPDPTPHHKGPDPLTRPTRKKMAPPSPLQGWVALDRSKGTTWHAWCWIPASASYPLHKTNYGKQLLQPGELSKEAGTHPTHSSHLERGRSHDM